VRIEVNGELDVLEKLLKQSIDILKPGGRLVVISYHSIEDRMVKNFIRSGNASGVLVKDFYGRAEVPMKAINRKVMIPTEEEIKRNPRARSAKLRIAEKL
jgi:16S rRNA (cytosine1402-N4)-methyltransferase